MSESRLFIEDIFDRWIRRFHEGTARHSPWAVTCTACGGGAVADLDLGIMMVVEPQPRVAMPADPNIRRRRQ